MSVFVLIPARGGSKGIPQKNIKSFRGKPLIQYTLDAARACFKPEQIVVSTDDVAIKNATDFRVEVELLIDKAVDPPSKHEQSINFVRLRGKQAYEYARAKWSNDQSTRQWEIMLDEDRQMLGGFLSLWESRGSGFSLAFLSEVKKNILEGIDEIVRLERSKND
jgi:hypothetical protein